MMGHVVCFRSGEIFIRRRAPAGSLTIMEGDGRRIRHILTAFARHAYDGKTLLVPGVPEAETDLKAMEAVKAFKLLILKRLAVQAQRRQRRFRRLI